MSVARDLEIVRKLIDEESDESLDAASELLDKIEKAQRASSDNGSGDEPDDGDDDEGDLDEEDEEDLEKLGPRKTKPRYPGDPSHAGLHYPEDDLTAAMGEDRQVEDPKLTHHETQMPRTSAMRRARLKQQAARLDRSGTFKRSLVDAEIAKGFSPTVARQRILHSHGPAALADDDPMAKATDSLVVRFMKRVDQTMLAERCDRTEALRRVRLAEPELYERFNLV
jgi:hypothetical protein